MRWLPAIHRQEEITERKLKSECMPGWQYYTENVFLLGIGIGSRSLIASMATGRPAGYVGLLQTPNWPARSESRSEFLRNSL